MYTFIRGFIRARPNKLFNARSRKMLAAGLARHKAAQKRAMDDVYAQPDVHVCHRTNEVEKLRAKPAIRDRKISAYQAAEHGKPDS